jgi:hypothetical protein
MYCLVNRDDIILPNKYKKFILHIGSYEGGKGDKDQLVVSDKRSYLLFSTSEIIKNIGSKSDLNSSVTKEELDRFKTNLKNLIYENILFEYDKYFGSASNVNGQLKWLPDGEPVNIITYIIELLIYTTGLLKGEPKIQSNYFQVYHYLHLFRQLLYYFIYNIYYI